MERYRVAVARPSCHACQNCTAVQRLSASARAMISTTASLGNLTWSPTHTAFIAQTIALDGPACSDRANRAAPENANAP